MLTSYYYTKCFMGYTTVGKTCLVLRFLNDEYEEIDDPTLGTAPNPLSISFFGPRHGCLTCFMQRTATGRSSWSTTTKSLSYATYLLCFWPLSWA
jgi:GTPase SAR1 family protein